MKLLLDTQVFIWLINQDKKLGTAASKTLNDPANEISISYFSFFEMTIKASIGKLEYNSEILEDLPKMGIELILPDVSLLKDYTIFDLGNKDPFDNALIAVARHEKTTFVTSDHKILASSVPGLKLLDATK
jgi:PIN domain nuclease of toxin-antitoxin system